MQYEQPLGIQPPAGCPPAGNMQNIHLLVKAVRGTTQNVSRSEEFVDRLHNRYTVVLLVIFTVVGAARVYFGRPIVCWAPAHFRPSHIRYSTAYCWVRNTYYLPFGDDIPRPQEKHEEILYYQWIPFIFLSQAAMFYFPSVIWRFFNSQHSGVDTESVVKYAKSIRTARGEERRRAMLKMLANQIHRFVGTPRPSSKSKSSSEQHVISRLLMLRPQGRRCRGGYLLALHIVVKCFYIANVIGQLFLLTTVLKTNYNIHGFGNIQKAIKEDDLEKPSDSAFPKVTMCDFNIRMMGNVVRYTVQCVLPINLYVEMMFAVLWYWMVFLLTLTCAFFIMWLLRAFDTADSVAFVRRRLHESCRIDSNRDSEAVYRPLVEDFVFDYLRQDGMFVMRLVCHNTDSITTSDIIGSLWDKWQETRKLGLVGDNKNLFLNGYRDSVDSNTTCPAKIDSDDSMSRSSVHSEVEKVISKII